MYILELQHKLIEVARERVQTGDVTERGLARMCNISQPHMHNVLKNVRTFSSEAYDRLMRALGVRVSDLLWHGAGAGDAGINAVPFVTARIGPATGATLTSVQGHLPMPAWLVQGLVDPLCARLAADLVMPAALALNDIVLLDRNPAVRVAPHEGSTWIVDTEAGLRARYAWVKAGTVYIGSEATRQDPAQWTAVSVQRRNILDIVRARIVWIGREMETQTAGPSGPFGKSY